MVVVLLRVTLLLLRFVPPFQTAATLARGYQAQKEFLLDHGRRLHSGSHMDADHRKSKAAHAGTGAGTGTGTSTGTVAAAARPPPRRRARPTAGPWTQRGGPSSRCGAAACATPSAHPS